MREPNVLERRVGITKDAQHSRRMMVLVGVDLVLQRARVRGRQRSNKADRAFLARGSVRGRLEERDGVLVLKKRARSSISLILVSFFRLCSPPFAVISDVRGLLQSFVGEKGVITFFLFNLEIRE